jgi:endo-1,4-beta-xylanase
MKAKIIAIIVLCLLIGAASAHDTDRPTLRELADQAGIYIGNVVSDSYEFEDNREVGAREFNFGTVEFYWFRIRPDQETYDFSYVDEQLEWAESHDMAILGHALVYGAAVNPAWFTEGDFTRQEYIDIMVDHISTVVSRYAGRVDTWVVTNESRIDGGWYDFFLDKIGPEYVEIAFATARQANPDAVLLYGDVDNETSEGEFTQFTRDLVRPLAEQGLIDGLSMQFHLNPGLRTYERQDMIDTLLAYELPIYITELDVDLRDTPGTQQERWAIQGDLYGLVLEIALELDVPVINVWGLSDRYSWKEYPAGETSSPISDPCLFDEDLQPKPAYEAWHAILTKAVSTR